MLRKRSYYYYTSKRETKKNNGALPLYSGWNALINILPILYSFSASVSGLVSKQRLRHRYWFAWISHIQFTSYICMHAMRWFGFVPTAYSNPHTEMSNGEYNTKNETNSIAIVSCDDINHCVFADHVLSLSHTNCLMVGSHFITHKNKHLWRDALMFISWFSWKPVNVMAGHVISYSTIKINLVMLAMRTIY